MNKRKKDEMERMNSQNKRRMKLDIIIIERTNERLLAREKERKREIRIYSMSTMTTMMINLTQN